MIKGRRPRRLRHSWEARCRLVEMVLSGLSPQAASLACGMSRSTAYRLLRRYQEGGWVALQDRAPVARHCPHRLSAEAEAQIVALRRQTGWGPRSLSAALGRPPSTIWRVLRRYDCSRQARQPRPAANRYEHAAVGDLIHLDIKKLGRFWRVGKRILNDGVSRSEGAGWQYAHVALTITRAWRRSSCAQASVAQTVPPSPRP
jgi:transposase